MRIALDIDGVLRDTYEKIKEIYKRYIPNGRIFKRNSYDLTQAMPDKYNGMNVRKLCIENLPCECFENAPQIVGAIEFVRRLIKNKHKIIYITVQEPQNIIYTINWLNKHGFMVNGTSLFFTDNKGLVRADFLLDDFIDNLICYQLGNLNGRAVCYAQEWNENYNGLRVTNYKEFEKIIKEVTP